MDLVDIGVNLSHDSFDHDRDEVVQQAREAGVARFVITGSSVAGSLRALEIAAPGRGMFYATAGVHPHHARELDRASIPELERLSHLPACVAIGECGLDFFRNFSTPEQQEAAFHAQLELAARVGMPVFLHQRDAHARFIGILREHLAAIPRGVAHCFTGGPHELEAYLDLGLYIGVTGWICDERRGHDLREAVTHIPLERLMIETDAPYLLPRDLKPHPRTRRNEPKYLPHVLAAVAALTGRDREELAAATTRNACDFFALEAADAARSIPDQIDK